MESKGVGVPMDPPPSIVGRSPGQTNRAIHGQLFPDSITSSIEVGAACGRLVHSHPSELRQLRFQPSPQPTCDQFASRIFETLDIVKTGVIQFCENGLPYGIDLVIVDAHLHVGHVLSGMEDYLEAMSMHRSALVASWNVR